MALSDLMAPSDLIRRIQGEADAQSAGDITAHARLLEGVRHLNLVLETPRETIMRVLFQVD